MAAISHGELPTKRRSVDVRMGKPGTCHGVSLRSEHIGPVEGTGGTETSHYPEERKATCDSLSSGERKGTSLNRRGGKPSGVATSGSRDRHLSHWRQDRVTKLPSSGSVLERHATAGNSPVRERRQPRVGIPSSAGTVKVGVNLRGPPRKAKYVQVTDSARVP